MTSPLSSFPSVRAEPPKEYLLVLFVGEVHSCYVSVYFLMDR